MALSGFPSLAAFRPGSLARTYPIRLADKGLVLEPLEGDDGFWWLVELRESGRLGRDLFTSSEQRAARSWTASARSYSRSWGRGDGGIWIIKAPTERLESSSFSVGRGSP